MKPTASILLFVLLGAIGANGSHIIALDGPALQRGFATVISGTGREGCARADVEEYQSAQSAEVDIGGQMVLTRGNANDEDGSFIRGDDGRVYFAWISDRAFGGRKGMDVWIQSSPDGLKWSLPWKAVQTEGEDLMSTLVRTTDGRYHLTGQILQPPRGHLGYSTWNATSFDLKSWTKPQRWTQSSYWAGGAFQEDSRGDYWLIYSTHHTDYNGQRDLYIKRSTNRGVTWENPLPLVTDPGDSWVFSFTIAADGTFVLLWETHDPSDPAGYLGNSAQVYLATSLDGRSWTAPKLLTPEEGTAYVDTIPALIEGPGNQLYALWLSTRPYLPNTEPSQVSVVMLPVAPHRDLTDRRLVPTPGYSVRSHVLPDGRILLAWVNHSSGNAHYYYRIVSGFDFPLAVPAP